jgi:pyrroloquinoline quinone biosynthesis protein E
LSPIEQEGPDRAASSAKAPRPYTLIAELTHRCALRCPYCSNPIDRVALADEIGTDAWLGAFEDAEELGVVQLHLTGGEPLGRRDLEALIAGARRLGLYTNLITSGVPLTRERLTSLRQAGLDALQLSVQGASAASSDAIAGIPSFDAKMLVARWTKELGLPLTLNLVLHRHNIHQVGEAVALAEALGAHRLELANAQYLGWALENRTWLLPAREDIDRAREVAFEARRRLAGRIDVLFVMPDYHSDRPRACMDGWARRFIHMLPDGTVLPCHAAPSITGLTFERVGGADRARLLGIWETSPALGAFRGDGWMVEPCRSCDRKAVDFGGCRCQAFLLTGNAAAADPACALSPHHGLVQAARRLATEGPPRRFLYRGDLSSSR